MQMFSPPCLDAHDSALCGSQLQPEYPCFPYSMAHASSDDANMDVRAARALHPPSPRAMLRNSGEFLAGMMQLQLPALVTMVVAAFLQEIFQYLDNQPAPTSQYG